MTAKTAACPSCKKPASLEATNASRPFCSDRCRLLDLGNWLDERYTISDPSLDGYGESFGLDD